MAATRKISASSKTAHVMNLISKNTTPAASTGSEDQQNGSSQTPQQPINKPPVIVSLSSDAAASEQIREALMDALESDRIEISSENGPDHEEAFATYTAAGTAAPAPHTSAPADPPASHGSGIPAAYAAASATLHQPSAPQRQAVPAVLPPTREVSPNTTYVNVMQVLVDENADKYIQLFGLCRCPRCVADVKALALNDLPPKYVVMETGHVVPRISVYEGRYQSAVTAQILRACKTVMEQPRHDEPI